MLAYSQATDDASLLAQAANNYEARDANFGRRSSAPAAPHLALQDSLATPHFTPPSHAGESQDPSRPCDQASLESHRSWVLLLMGSPETNVRQASTPAIPHSCEPWLHRMRGNTSARMLIITAILLLLALPSHEICGCLQIQVATFRMLFHATTTPMSSRLQDITHPFLRHRRSFHRKPPPLTCPLSKSRQ
jgi:hypothetical protein